MLAKYKKYILLQCVFTLSIFLLLLYFFVRYDQNRLEYELSNIGQALNHTIKEHIDSNIGVLTSLGYNFEIEESLTKYKFSILSAHYIKQYPEIIYIQHKNSETVTDMVYPEKEYSYTLGATLKGRKEVEEAVMKAINEKRITANDPFILKNTKDLLGLVIRYPIYKNGRFEGFFVVVMDVNHFLKNLIGENITEKYHVSFYDSKGNSFWGSQDENCKHSYFTSIQILDNSWGMRVTHIEPAISSTFLFIAVTGVIFIIVVALLIYVQVNFYKKDSNIDHLTNLKNELEEIQERYALALDSANDALWEWNIETGEVFASEKWLDIDGPFEVDDKTIHITASIGVVFHSGQACSVSETLRNADTALNKAKANGKNRYCFYDVSMYQAILRRTTVEAGLRKAMDNGELYLNYQLQQDLRSGEISGIEVLARWRSKELGLVSPAEFIAVAEDTELIIPLGNWILNKACEQGKAWLDKGYHFGRMAVNISTVQLLSSDFFMTVKEIMQSTGFPAECLEFEITESIMLNSTDNNMKLLRDIKSIGVSIALDDFGTGYSSLNYLTVMPINALKIDKSFINKACDSKLGQQITNSIIELAHNMELDVIAEGIEAENQIELLKQMDCDKIQGYYFAVPMAAENVEKRFKT